MGFSEPEKQFELNVVHTNTKYANNNNNNNSSRETTIEKDKQIHTRKINVYIFHSTVVVERHSLRIDIVKTS